MNNQASEISVRFAPYPTGIEIVCKEGKPYDQKEQCQHRDGKSHLYECGGTVRNTYPRIPWFLFQASETSENLVFLCLVIVAICATRRVICWGRKLQLDSPSCNGTKRSRFHSNPSPSFPFLPFCCKRSKSNQMCGDEKCHQRNNHETIALLGLASPSIRLSSEPPSAARPPSGILGISWSLLPQVSQVPTSLPCVHRYR